MSGAANGDVVVREVVRRAPGGRVVLDRLTATFGSGQVTVVHGPNGSGKSMLARVIAGVDRPDAGSLTLPPSAAFLLPERAAVLPGCSARTLAAALARSVGRGDRTWAGRLDDALERLGSTHSGFTPMSRLSKGNLQKAYLAVGYALRPALAVLDEPMSGFDAAAASAASTLIRDMSGGGHVVVVTAHRPGGFAHRNQQLVDGRLAESSAETAEAFASFAYLVDLGPLGPARSLLAGGVRQLRVVEVDLVATDRVRVRVDADGLDLLLGAAIKHDLKITRIVEDTES